MISIFTSITGGKDTLLEDKENKGKADFVAFLDTPYLSPTWRVQQNKKLFIDERRNSRIPKLLPHLFTTNEYSIWIDGNIRLLKSPEELIAKHLKDHDIAVYKHPTRDCLYDEASKCAVLGLDDAEVIIEQAKAYEDSSFAKHRGLAECGIIFRRHTDKVRQFNNEWFAQYCRYSVRDQISFMFAADIVSLPVKIIDDFFIETSRTHAIKQSGDAEIFIHKK
jgi:hypothetical protein